MSNLPPRDFESLVAREYGDLDAETTSGPGKAGAKDKPVIATPGSSGEPWIARTPHDRFGLALSGGGIRSATFNLGILRALGSLGLLQDVDYLSTVSGGGYVGGFWTRWRQRMSGTPESASKLFPSSAESELAGGLRDIRDPEAIRHLREFSGFLIPRLGASRSELWGAFATLVAGLVPSLVASAAVVVLGVVLWVFGEEGMISQGPVVCASLLTFGTAVLLWLSEQMAMKREQFDQAPIAIPCYFANAMFGLIGVWGGCWYSFRWINSPEHAAFFLSSPLRPFLFPVSWLAGFAVVRGLLHIASIYDAATIQDLMMRILAGLRRAAATPTKEASEGHSGSWQSGLIAIYLRRMKFMKDETGRRKFEGLVRETIRSVPTAWAAAHERVLARLLALALPWAFVTSLWLLAQWLRNHSIEAGKTGSVGAVLTLVFAAIRRWLADQDRTTASAGKWLARVRSWIPQILAHAVVVLAVLTAMLFVLNARSNDWSWGWLIGIPTGILLGALLMFDPQKLGHHEFYRSRIARSFLGAANPEGVSAFRNRQSAERADDDMPISGDMGRPIHLVSCAVNALGGDQMSTLHRGARSAVLSRNGLSIGNHVGSVPHLGLSSALTASAAAFNSCMGRYSVSFGPAVAFLMTALDLRLGLWVRHPANNPEPPSLLREAFNFPGIQHFREMFSLAAYPNPPTRRDNTPIPRQPDVHLSDGGHFENLGLYELVRRHCRHIIVSDCGADPLRTFADLGMAVRRVREDFGVEIELDLSGLRRGENGFAGHHMAVGTIHYDRVVGTDKGTLIYFKPGLTGDEPVDILQYASENPLFPHEGTLDQFYDEAQWESYHKLGFHSALFSLRFLETRISDSGEHNLADAFREARRRTEALPWGSGAVYLQLTERTSQVEESIRRNVTLAAEFFPEGTHSRPSPEGKLHPETVFAMLRVAQLMEEIWHVCDLSVNRAHPLARGWMTYLSRWASMPTLRRWWPLLAPLFGAQFLRFAEKHLHLPKPGPDGTSAITRLRAVDSIPDLMSTELWRHWEMQYGDKLPAFDQVFVLDLQLADVGKLPVAMALTGRDWNAVYWKPESLFAPASLNGGGFHSGMLDALISHFGATEGVQELRLDLSPPKGDIQQEWLRDPGERRARLELIDFYKSRQFALAWTPTEVMVRRLNPEVGGKK